MKILKEGCPSKDGFHMPAEYEPHKGTILIWPKRSGSWIYGAKKAREAFADVICATAESETVYLLVEAEELDHAQMIIEAVRKEKTIRKIIRSIIWKLHRMMHGRGMSDRPLLSMGRGRYGELTGVLMHGVESVTDCMQTGKRMIK